MSITLLAAGSPDPRHEADIRLLAGRLKLTEVPAQAVFLEHNLPSPCLAAARMLESGTPATTVVPLLISAAWRLRADVSAALTTMAALAAGTQVWSAPPIGVHPLLLAAAGELLADHPVAPDTGLVLVTAGLRDPRTRATLDRLVADTGPLLASAHGLRAVRIAHVDAGRPIWPIRTLLQRLDSCAHFLALPLVLTCGLARDRVTRMALRDDIPVVSGSLAQTQALADLVSLRARAARPVPVPVPAA